MIRALEYLTAPASYSLLLNEKLLGMEKDVQKCVDDMMSSPGVVGVLCADKQGMCLTSQGTADPKFSGPLTSLTQLASTIETGKGDPVILFEGQESQCMLHRNSGVTLAVYKTKS